MEKHNPNKLLPVVIPNFNQVWQKRFILGMDVAKKGGDILVLSEIRNGKIISSKIINK